MKTKKCLFCSGAYEIKIDTDRGLQDRNKLIKYGLQPTGAKHWIVAICQKCGHMAVFNPKQ